MTTKKILNRSFLVKLYAAVISAGIFAALNMAAAHAETFCRQTM